MESENSQNQRSSPVSYSAYAVDKIPEIDSVEENLAHAATVNSNPSDRKAKAIQINEGSHSTELEAKGFEGKEEADEDAIDLISAPKLDCNEIGSNNFFFLTEEFEQEEKHGEPVLQSKDEPAFHRLDSGFYSGGQFESFEAGSEEDSLNQQSRFAFLNDQSSQSVSDAPVHLQSSQSVSDTPVQDQSSQSVKDAPIQDQSSQSVRGVPVRDQSNQSVKDAPIQNQSSQSVKDAAVHDQSSQSVKDTPVRDQSSQSVSNAPVHDQSSQLVKDAPVQDQSSQSVKDAPIQNQSSQSVKDAAVHDQSSQSVKDTPVRDQSSQSVSNAPVHDQSSQLVKDAPVQDQSSQSMKDAPVHDQSNQSVKDAPVHDQSSQSLKHREMQDLVPSNTLNEETKCFQVPLAGDQGCNKNRKRKSIIDNGESMKWHIAQDEEFVYIYCCQNQKLRKKKPGYVNFSQECRKILRKFLQESILSKQMYIFFAFAKAKKYLKKWWKGFGQKKLRPNGTCDLVVCPVLPSDLELTNHDMKVEWDRLYSFASLSGRFEKVSTLSLATAGFYHRSKDRKIQCFTCNKCYSPEYLEDHLQACGTSIPPTDLHEDWCLISDHGNIPINSDPSCNNIGNPSCYKRQFKDADGKLIQYRNVCGLNTFFVDLKHILTEFPALKDALRNTKSGKAILEMLEHGKLNSARGIHHILLLLERKPEETIFNLENFELIKFLCELNEKEIEIKRSCHRNCQMERIFTLEQIIINPPKTRDGSKNIIQQGIFEAFCPSNNCSECKETVRLTFRHPPPVLFLNVWRIRHLVGSAVPPVVHVLGHRYRIGAVYMHKDQHFTAWIYKPREGQEWTYYDDSNVSRHDQFSAVFDDAKIFPGEGSMVVISYYLADP